MAKEFREAIKKKIEWGEPRFGPCMKKIEGLPYEQFRENVETYREAIVLTYMITKELLSETQPALTGFAPCLTADLLAKIGRKSCGTYAIVAGSILNGMGIETKVVKGIGARGARFLQDVQPHILRVEHTWNAIKVGDTWMEVDFSHKAGPVQENYVGLVGGSDFTDFLDKYIKFKIQWEYYENMIQILE